MGTETDELSQVLNPRDRDPEEPILKYFAFAHLPPPLQEVSKAFGELAVKVVAGCCRSAERSVALRKLLEAKDAPVRAALDK
jgi:hypothetical protein